jgi:multiple sugar transport system ATP-binding protein
VRQASSLTVHDLRVSYGRVVALDGVSLEVLPGEFMVLLGPSGCGKSTLLGAIAGLLPLASGRVMLGGRDLVATEPADRNIAVVFQSYALYPTMTAARNITFGMRMRGASRAEAATALTDVARLLRLEPVLERKPAQLSGGQRQRVAIGRALVRDPVLFLFDEPLSNLDAKLRAEMRAEIKLLHQRLGTTCVYVTHDQVEAMTMASRVAVMRDGRILQVGTPRAVYDRPESLFVAGFVGSPGMNLIPGRIVFRGGRAALEAGGALLPLDRYAWAAPPAEGRPAVLGIRPEDVGVAGGGDAFVTTMTPMLVEPTGSDTLLRLPFAGTEITARVHRDHDAVVGEAASYAFDLSHASVFCPETGGRL